MWKTVEWHATSLAAILLSALPLMCFGYGYGAKPSALFVFGDSYADTGNHNEQDPTLYAPWRPPYGHSWPGLPAGRYSDGGVVTDFIASSLNISSPVPYRVMTNTSSERIAPAGINFAFGGSGVFHTFGPQYPTLSTQITRFQETLEIGVFSQEFLATSLVLLVVAGNDYAVYRQKHPGDEALTVFISKVVDQMAAALQKLYSLGLRRFAVSNLEPIGCLPAVTSTSEFAACSEVENAFSMVHNKMLSTHISNLNKLQGAQFTTLDFYSSFSSSIRTTFGRGNANPLQPCCQGVGNSSCGSLDSKGRPLYTVCSNPREAFFWDSYHPSQAGWEAVSKLLLEFIQPLTFLSILVDLQ